MEAVAYMQIIPQTMEEKIKMYMKMPKKDLAKMLASCNLALDSRQISVYTPANQQPVACDVCKKHPSVVITTPYGTFCQEHVRFS